MTSVSLHDQFAAMGWWVFKGCTSLTEPICTKQFLSYVPANYVGSYTIPNKVIFLRGAFEDSYGLTSVVVSDRQTKLDQCAFQNAPSLTSITIGRSVAEIENYAFLNIPNLEELILLPTTPPAINEAAFSNGIYNKVKLIVPSEAYNAYKQHEVWGKFGNIEYETIFNITLDEREMVIGDTQQAKINRTPNIENEQITWSSSDDSIISVDGNGCLTAKAIGSATITAVCANITSVCEVSVISRRKDEIVYGYCDDFVGDGIGSGTQKPIKCAIRIPSSVTSRYKDCTITRIDVGVSDNVFDLVPVISIGGEENYAAQATINGDKGWNAIELDNPYVIGSGDLYVGYECVGTYAAATSNIYSQNGSYIYEEDAWKNYGSRGWGSFCIRFHIKGYDLPIDVALMTDQVIQCALGETIEFHPNVQNLSPEVIESMVCGCYIDDIYVGSQETEIHIEKGSIVSASVPVSAPETTGTYKVTLKVESVNGKPDEMGGNDVVTIPLTVSGKTFARRVVVEEITGTWCGYCVRGYVGMKEMAEKYPDDFIGIAIHGGDSSEPMVGAENYNGIFSLLGGSYPSCIANRNTKYDIDPNSSEIETTILALKENALADIKAEMEVLDSDTTQLLIKTSTEFGMDATTTFRIAYVVVENGVGPYVQTNYYSGTNTEMGGFENESYFVNLIYNDVARGIYPGFNGDAGSLPNTIKEGQIYNYNYQLKVPDNVDCKSNIEVVALLINQESGEIINACKCQFAKKDDAITKIEEDNNEIGIYKLDGVHQRTLSPGLNIIRRQGKNGKKVFVK